jgi:hypothetical protein
MLQWIVGGFCLRYISDSVQPVVGLLLFVYSAAVAAAMGRLRCPRCGERVKQGRPLGLGRLWPPAKCPHCGLPAEGHWTPSVTAHSRSN